MTWCKFGTEFFDDLANAGLSDAAVRTHAEAISWIYRVEQTDLRIPKHLVRRFAGSEAWEVAVKDLVAAEFWRDDGDGYVVIHHADVIRASIYAQRKKRERDKRSQQAHRDRAAKPDVSADADANVSAYADSQTDKQAAMDGSATKEPTGDAYEYCCSCKLHSKTVVDGRCSTCRQAEAS